MDHANAHLMELTNDAMETKIIVSKFTHEENKYTKITSNNRSACRLSKMEDLTFIFLEIEA